MSPRGSGPAAPPSAPVRRPGGEDSASDGGRREGPGGPRTAPAPGGRADRVAAPLGRPAALVIAAAPKSQRPEKSMTRDEMMALMRSGGLNTFQSPASPPGTGQGGRTGQPQRGAGPAGPPRPGAPPSGPAARRPGPGPGARAAVDPSAP